MNAFYFLRVVIESINTAAESCYKERLRIGDTDGAAFFARIEWLTAEMLRQKH